MGDPPQYDVHRSESENHRAEFPDEYEAWDEERREWRFVRQHTFLGGIVSELNSRTRSVDMIEMKCEFGGGKTIRTLGSVCLLFNNLTGPGMVVLAGVYASVGWLMPTILIFLCGVGSIISAFCLCEVMSHVPGNSFFDDRVEWMYMARRCLSRKSFKAVEFAYYFSFMTTLISMIVQTSQAMDRLFVKGFGASCALNLGDLDFTDYVCTERLNNTDSPFGEGVFVSMGFVLVSMMSIPLGMWNLDDNIDIQKAACLFLLICTFVFCAQFHEIIYSHPSHIYTLPAVQGESISAWQPVFGTILFNFAFSTTVPSWLNEKNGRVPVKRPITVTVILGCLSFVLLGYMGAAAFPYESADTDLLSKLLTRQNTWLLTQICCILFPVAANLTGIPVFAIVMRYNLLMNGNLKPKAATFWCVVFPFLISPLFYGGDLINSVVNWGGLLTGAVLNIMLPCYFFLLVRKAERMGETKHLLSQPPSEDDSDGYCSSDDSYTVPALPGRLAGLDNSLMGRPPEAFRALPRGKKGDQIALTVIGVTAVLNGLAIFLTVWQQWL